MKVKEESLMMIDRLSFNHIKNILRKKEKVSKLENLRISKLALLLLEKSLQRELINSKV
jgi:hypothetical protein